MNNKKTSPSGPALAGRRRLLGVIAASGAPVVAAALPGAARAATVADPVATPSGPGPASHRASGGLIHREGWLLARSDR
ncbi:MAG: hypothetical protein WCZ28_09530 [Burkholderiaceae bacterium]